jgi:anti-sigma-K factor RskA
MDETRHKIIQDSLPAYALDALEPEEQRTVDEHLAAGCDDCRRAVKDYRSVTDQIALSLSPVTPNIRVKQRLLERINRLPREGMETRRREDTGTVAASPTRRVAASEKRRVAHSLRWQWLGWTTALAASVALFFFVQQNAELRQQIADQAAELARLQGQVADLRQVLVTLRDPDVRLARLTGSPKTPEASARMLWNPRQHAGYFYAHNLPPLSPDKTYQLWVIAEGPPIGAGIFSVNQQGSGEIRVEPLAQAENVKMFAVTIEPAGGREQPTLDQMVLSGTY